MKHTTCPGGSFLSFKLQSLRSIGLWPLELSLRIENFGSKTLHIGFGRDRKYPRRSEESGTFDCRHVEAWLRQKAFSAFSVLLSCQHQWNTRKGMLCSSRFSRRSSSKLWPATRARWEGPSLDWPYDANHRGSKKNKGRPQTLACLALILIKGQKALIRALLESKGMCDSETHSQ
jgi:hypothetical protein